MTYKSILVNLDLDRPIGPLVTFSKELAKAFGARLIGVCASDIPPLVMASEGADFGAEVMLRERDDLEKRLGEVKKEFNELAGDVSIREWRSGILDPTRLLVKLSRAADLIVTAKPPAASLISSGQHIDLGSVVLQSGRPLLISGTEPAKQFAHTIVVAWKDTREARRAVADAIPLLLRAREVFLITVSDKNDMASAGLKDVAEFLGCHGIKTRIELIRRSEEAAQLFDFARAVRADLMVSGAYGHSRLREWAFGGMTRSLLDEVEFCRFMSS